ncbi:MAG: nucleotidyltransferase family protein [Gammaproteobacteria bacterium]
MRASSCLLLEVLRQPGRVQTLQERDWDLVVRQGRRANVLGRVCVLLEEHRLLNAVPQAARGYLLSDRRLASRHAASVRWEVNRILHALSPLNVPVILLKGAAYTLADLPPARGRLFYDIDILVPRESLNATEQALHQSGWISTHLDRYDQRYFREWMHELPPMQHSYRKTLLDVHHTITPLTSALHPQAAILRAGARPLQQHPGLYTLAPADMVLHSAVHLFYSDGEFEQGLRDLTDLSALLRHFSEHETGFWSKLIERAQELGLTRPLHYALRYTSKLLGTTIPATISSQAATNSPPRLAAQWRDQLFLRALKPAHPSCADWATDSARWLLYVRSHYLRMPLRLLLPHLIRKAVRRRFRLRNVGM